MKVNVLVAQSCLTLCDPMDCRCQAPLSMGFSRQKYWSGLPFPSPGNLPNTGVKPGSPALRADSLPFEPSGKPRKGREDSKSARKIQHTHTQPETTVK